MTTSAATPDVKAISNKYVDPVCDEDANDHDLNKTPCSNWILGIDFPQEDEQWKCKDAQSNVF